MLTWPSGVKASSLQWPSATRRPSFSSPAQTEKHYSLLTWLLARVWEPKPTKEMSRAPKQTKQSSSVTFLGHLQCSVTSNTFFPMAPWVGVQGGDRQRKRDTGIAGAALDPHSHQEQTHKPIPSLNQRAKLSEAKLEFSGDGHPELILCRYQRPPWTGSQARCLLPQHPLYLSLLHGSGDSLAHRLCCIMW